jgi:SAM-dependent methyltransferase
MCGLIGWFDSPCKGLGSATRHSAMAAATSSAEVETTRTKWNSRYGVDEFVYGRECNAWLARADGIKHLVPDGSAVVELASGEGRNAVWLAQQGYSVTGVDISEVGTEKSRKLAAELGVSCTFVTTDATAFGDADSQDAAVCVFAHVPPALKGKLFENIERIVRPGGFLFAQWYTPEHVRRKDAGGWGIGGPPAAEPCKCVIRVLSILDGHGCLVCRHRQGPAPSLQPGQVWQVP